jgi:hypothetical protein
VTEVGEGLDDKVANLLRVVGVDAGDAFARGLTSRNPVARDTPPGPEPRITW